MKSLWDDFVVAIRFLTVIPIGLEDEVKKRSLATATIFFPFVGFLIASLSLAITLALEKWFPENLSNLMLVLLPILLTGGLHVDGFADFCDGFFGGTHKADVLEIMKDPRIGTWGGVGVTLLILWKFELLQALPDRSIFFLMALTCSRWAQVALSFYLPYAGEGGGLSETVAHKVRFREFFGATLFLLPLFFWVRIPGCLVFAGLITFLFLLALFFRKRIGGLTGDLLGATSELSEICIYIFAVVLIKG